MFGNCISLKSVVIPEGVEGCEDYNPGIFNNCTSLTSIDISSSAVENLYMIFRDIDAFINLKTIIIRQATPPSITSYKDVQAISSPNIYVPASSVELYQATAPWNQWGQILPIVESVELADGEVYSGVQRNVDEFTYTRTFDNTAWQSMYVPFSIPVNVLEEKGLEVAEIYNVHQYDRDDDGIYEETNIDFLKMKSGATQANYPYMVRAKETGDVTFEFSSIEIAGAESVSIDCSTVKQLFTFTGTYDGVSGSVMYDNNYYGMTSAGALQRAASSSASLNPQRWYLSIENRDGSPMSYYAPNLRITVDGIEEEGFETTIEVISVQAETDAVYTLSGKRVGSETLAPGLYVKNGKKMMVK